MSFPRISSLSGLSLVGLPRMLRAGRASLGLCVASVFGQAQDFAELSFEDLTDIAVVETSKSASRLFDAPVSAFVFDEEAIRYLPVDSVPELLRYAPGVHVMRASNGTWGVGIRGLTSRNLSRTLFTVDDQNFTSRVYSGLFGIEHDLLFEDIASVEVVYGPGGGLWDSNAMNGNVNVLMKSAFETEGGFLRVQKGNQLSALAGRVGWLKNEDTAMRVFAKVSHREPNATGYAEDAQSSVRTGFRMDHSLGSKGLLTATAEWAHGHLGTGRERADLETGLTYPVSSKEEQSLVSGELRYTFQDGPGHGWDARLWAAYAETDSIYLKYDMALVGTKFRWRREWDEGQKIQVSAGTSIGEQSFGITPTSRYREGSNGNWVNAHVGAEYTRSLVPEVLDLVGGLSLNYDSSDERTVALPFTRLLWRPWEGGRFWMGYGRGVRATPQGVYDLERAELRPYAVPAIGIPTPGGEVTVDRAYLYVSVAERLHREELDTYEIGFRQQGSNWTYRASAFVSHFDQLLGVESAPEIVFGRERAYFLEEMRLDNRGRGKVYGIEMSIATELTETLAVQVSGSVQDDRFASKRSGAIQGREETAAENRAYGDVPAFMGSIWANWQFHEAWRLDLGWRYSSAFESNYARQEAIDEVDARLTWQPQKDLWISLVGRNLSSSAANEKLLNDLVIEPLEIRREWYLEVRYEF